MHDGPEQEARDKIFLSQLGSEIQGAFPSRWTCPVIQPWIYGYDAREEVEAAIRAQPFPDISEHTSTTSKPSTTKPKLPSFIERILNFFKLVTRN